MSLQHLNTVLLLSIVLVSDAEEDVTPCPTDFTSVGGTCYHVDATPQNYVYLSAKYCRDKGEGSRLVELETAEEFAAFQDWLDTSSEAGHDCFHTGGVLSDDGYVWVSSGAAVVHDMATGQSGDHQHVVYGKSWNRQLGDQVYFITCYPVCEVDPSLPPRNLCPSEYTLHLGYCLLRDGGYHNDYDRCKERCWDYYQGYLLEVHTIEKWKAVKLWLTLYIYSTNRHAIGIRDRFGTYVWERSGAAVLSDIYNPSNAGSNTYVAVYRSGSTYSIIANPFTTTHGCYCICEANATGY